MTLVSVWDWYQSDFNCFTNDMSSTVIHAIQSKPPFHTNSILALFIICIHVTDYVSFPYYHFTILFAQSSRWLTCDGVWVHQTSNYFHSIHFALLRLGLWNIHSRLNEPFFLGERRKHWRSHDYRAVYEWNQKLPTPVDGTQFCRFSWPKVWISANTHVYSDIRVDDDSRRVDWIECGC